ncbi:hypothetical protein VNI00_004329 [Paramarasmius palmivorus]|uniref:Uncharacterized protein n=1 Tax=Paramarasmius palmivorus TaxID=297713 RepID=A0AAW0DN27_9AGAR
MEPLPYNITVSSSAASLKYSPARDTRIEWGWNITYSDGVYNSPYGPQGIGSAIHRTTKSDSTIELNWVGTAVYLYGNATRFSYRITVDGVDIGDTGGQGLLGSKTGLQYGEHSAVLTALGGSTVSFWYADVTIGAGYPGSSPLTKRVPAIIEDSNAPSASRPNSFFTFRPDTSAWSINTSLRSNPEPNKSSTLLSPSHEMYTNKNGASVAFTISKTSAFLLWGTLNRDHGNKSVTLTSANGSLFKSIPINDYSSILDFDQIIYWESGLDREQTYLITITVEPDSIISLNHLGFANLDLIDSGPTPTTAAEPSGTAGTSLGEQQSSGLSTGAVAGIAVGVVLAVIAACFIAFCLWRRRKRHVPLRYRPNVDPPSAPFLGTPAVFTNVPPQVREADGGPVVTLPPQYDDGWTASSETPSWPGVSPTSGMSPTSLGSLDSIASPSRRRALPTPPSDSKRVLVLSS